MSGSERRNGVLCVCRLDIGIVSQWCCALRTLLLMFGIVWKLLIMMPMKCFAGVLPISPTL